MNPLDNKKPVVVIALITAVCLLGDSMLYVVLPIHWKEAGLSSLWEVGVLLSINRFVRLPLNPFIGWLYKRMSKRQGILIAVLLAAITTASYGLNHVFGMWLLMRAVWGVAWSLLRIGAYFTILELSNDHNRGHFMGTYNGLYRLGSLGGMLIGAIAADIYGIKIIALIFASLTLLAVPFVLKYVSPLHTESAPNSSRGIIPSTSLWRKRNVLWTLVTGLFLAMIYQGMFTATVSHMIQVHEASSTIHIWFLSIGAASVAGVLQSLRWGWEPWLAPLFGKISDGKMGRRPLFTFFLALAALLFALVPFHLPFGLWISILILIQLTATALNTIMDAITSDIASQTSKIAVMTTYAVITDLGAAIGPSLGYFIVSMWGTSTVYWGTTGILLIMFLRWVVPLSAVKEETLKEFAVKQ